jgi:hypothetical protein
MPDFPILDSERNGDNDPGRIVIQEHGAIEPYLPEIDYWCTMPVRLVYTVGLGGVIEIGPYTLNRDDIARLRAAIADYDTGARLMRGIK